MKTMAIIFSMDRAMQCESLVRSMKDMCTGIDSLTVIRRASSRLHIDAYDAAAAAHKDVPFCAEAPDFGCAQWLDRTLTSTMPDYVCINVDDQIYYRPADFTAATRWLEQDDDAFVWSWRLGMHPLLTEQASPWRSYWRCERPLNRHYGYVWHSDGALYERSKYVGVLDREIEDWRTLELIPNDIEKRGARPRHPHQGAHLGPLQPCCMTWQINKEVTTKNKYGAPWASIPATELDALAKAFLAGKRVDNKILYTDRSWTRRFQAADAYPTHVHACPEAAAFYATLIR